jgi:malonate transporter
VSLHSLVILTTATVVLELAVSRDATLAAKRDGVQVPARPMLATVLTAVRNAVLHPVPIPIIVGLLFAQTGWVLPEVIDKPVQLLGQAFGPLALVMVGITLAHTAVGQHLRGALVQALVKNLLHPVLVVALGWALSLTGLPLTVMVVAASLPIGANVFLFSQRYKVAEELVTASVAVSTALALVTVSVVMALVG